METTKALDAVMLKHRGDDSRGDMVFSYVVVIEKHSDKTSRAIFYSALIDGISSYREHRACVDFDPRINPREGAIAISTIVIFH